MKYFYSPETNGFYIEGLHATMPSDVIELTQGQYQDLIVGQAAGKVIGYKSRKVQLLDFAVPEVTWDQIRTRRDALLTACDWTQIPDNALNADLRETWKTYRQTLRDITTKFKKASQVIWPLVPSMETD